MWHCIFSISFTGSKSISWKTNIHLITASNNSQNTFVIYVIDLSTKNKMQRREFILYKNKKYRRLERGKKMYFLVISFQEFLNFPIWAFSKNVQFFLGVFLKANIFVLIKTFWRRRRTTSSSRRMFVGYYYNYYCQHCIRCCGGDASKWPSDGNFFWLLLV